MIFYQYKETCEVLLDDSKIGGDNIKDFVKKAIGNILHANIDVHSRRLFADFPVYGVECIEKLQSHCANMKFSYKSRHNRIFLQVTHKGGKSEMKFIMIFQNVQALSVLAGNTYSVDKVMYIFLDNLTKVENILIKYLSTRQS